VWPFKLGSKAARVGWVAQNPGLFLHAHHKTRLPGAVLARASGRGLESWYAVMRKADWKTPAELRQVYPNADLVGRRTVFDIAGSKYRLIARVNYQTQRVFVLYILTHSEYERRLETMSTTTMELNEKAYRQLLGRTLPHVIRTEEEYERLTNELVRLDERENPSREEKELTELLTVLMNGYEGRRYPIRKASPQQPLQHLMETRQLTQKDLWKVFGSKGITSEVFHGKRSISKAQARKRRSSFTSTSSFSFSRVEVQEWSRHKWQIKVRHITAPDTTILHPAGS
jgi:mRNA-degrading endonuclease HigB of HigAB toxin-antitoxin module/antitoxin component HigA of HigAB toxin-antitoxin module